MEFYIREWLDSTLVSFCGIEVLSWILLKNLLFILILVNIQGSDVWMDFWQFPWIQGMTLGLGYVLVEFFRGLEA